MIKQMLEYVDIDGQRTSRTVMFNLTQFEVEGEMELEVIQARFEKFQEEVVGTDPEAPIREMTGPEKREMLGIVKTLIRHAYGVREGKRFVKSEEIWSEFEQTGAFSAFLYWLFEKPERANSFMSGIWPQGVDRPEDEPSPDLKIVPDVVEGQIIESRDDMGLTVETPSIEDPASDATDATDDPERWNYINFTRDELLTMSDEDFDKVVEQSRQGRNVPGPLNSLRMQRKSRGGSGE